MMDLRHNVKKNFKFYFKFFDSLNFVYLMERRRWWKRRRSLSKFFEKILFFYFIFFLRLLYRKLFPVGWAVPSILYDTIPFVSHLYVHNIPPSFLFLCVCLFSIYNLQVKKKEKKSGPERKRGKNFDDYIIQPLESNEKKEKKKKETVRYNNRKWPCVCVMYHKKSPQTKIRYHRF